MILPTGTVVKVEEGYRIFMSVFVTASVVDNGHTEGLCGTFDGDVTNEFTKSDGSVDTSNGLRPDNFIASWR